MSTAGRGDAAGDDARLIAKPRPPPPSAPSPWRRWLLERCACCLPQLPAAARPGGASAGGVPKAEPPSVDAPCGDPAHCAPRAAEGEERQVAATAREPAPVNVGFASLELRATDSFPGKEVYMLALACTWDAEGVLAMFDFLGGVLDSPLTRDGFILTYDFQTLISPQADVLSDLVSWTLERNRRDRWQAQCIGWRVVVPSAAYYPFKILLHSVFFLYPPSCSVYLVTGLEQPLDESTVCYQPAETVMAAPILRPVGAEFAARPSAEPRGDGIGRGHRASSSASSSAPVELPPITKLGFAELHQGPGYFKIIGTDEDISDEGIQKMLDTMDLFTASANARAGFGITYDLRAMRSPSMQMVQAVAEWGTDPKRKKTWVKLNRACKVVISPGLRFSVCKGILTTFFFVCPPIVRTFLMTDLDEPEDGACVFEPTETDTMVSDDSDDDGQK